MTKKIMLYQINIPATKTKMGIGGYIKATTLKQAKSEAIQYLRANLYPKMKRLPNGTKIRKTNFTTFGWLR